MSVRLLPSIISNGTLHRLTNISPRNSRGNKAATAGTFYFLSLFLSLSVTKLDLLPRRRDLGTPWKASDFLPFVTVLTYSGGGYSQSNPYAQQDKYDSNDNYGGGAPGRNTSFPYALESREGDDCIWRLILQTN